MKIEAGPDQVWTIAARGLPPFPVRTGSLVTASYFFSRGEFSPDRSALILRVGGRLAFYYGIAGSVEDMSSVPIELELKRGDATCKRTDDCLTWFEYDLEMSVNGGKPVVLGTGQSKTQGDYLLQNFRSAGSTGKTNCLDAFVADTTILVARASPLFEDPDTDAGLEGL
jgi:hypothetical protein